jgi:hypothetical protein
MTASRLDDLAAELAREVRDASGARADAEVAAAFDGMTSDVNVVASEIEQHARLLRGGSSLSVPAGFPGELAERTLWVNAQIKKIRETIESDPMRVRQGNLWRETQRAFRTLSSELAETVDAAYSALMDTFRGDDREVLETLPPGISDAHDYRVAIAAFEGVAEARPTTAAEVTDAAAVGRRLVALREQVEAQAVPVEFREQWRRVRTSGLPLDDVTEPFTAWLRERGLANSTVLTIRAR